MKQMMGWARLAILAALTLIAGLPPVDAKSDAAPRKVLLLPFTIHAEKDLSFLKSGIADMLSSRLSGTGKVIPVKHAPVGPPPTDDADLISLAKRAGADFVIAGSITLFGNSAATGARLIAVDSGDVLVNFNHFGEKSSDVLAHVNAFADQVQHRLVGTPTAAAGPTSVPTTPAAHARSTPPPADAPQDPGGASEKVWQSTVLPMAVRGVSVGELDGSGNAELVAIDAHTLRVFRFQEGRLVEMARHETSRFNAFLAVDTADINADGRAEIFVTSIDQQVQGLNSFVLEWDGSRLVSLQENLNWYFRVLDIPGRSPVLMGQQRGRLGDSSMYEFDAKATVFRGPVTELQWSGGVLKAMDRAPVPAWVNIFNFAWGDVRGTGKNDLVAFTDSMHLTLADPGGNRQWTSAGDFGGGNLYLEIPPRHNQPKKDRYYLPQRIQIADLDGDGQNEVYVIDGHDMAGGMVGKFRRIDSGTVRGLNWRNLSLQADWQSDEISGYISDLALGDLDGDGRRELVFPVIKPSGGVLTKKQSTIVFWHRS